MVNRNLIKCLLGLVIILMSSSCTYIKNVKLLLGGKLERKNFVQSIPFEWRKDLIVVKARINQDTTLREFIFDTGAFNSKVESNLADHLGLKVVTEKKNSTAQGITKSIQVLLVDSVQLGETKFYNIGAGKLSYGPTSASPCIAEHGIIGANLIKLAHWRIDYQNKMLHFSDKPFENEVEEKAISFKKPLLSGTPSISMMVDEKRIDDILFDVGFNGGLVLPISLVNEFKSDDTEIILDQSTSGIYGTNTDSIIVKKLKVNLGGHTETIPVEFSSLNKTLLGNEFLKHFNVSIDYDKKKIYIAKQKNVFMNDPYKFLAGMMNDTTWVVTRTNQELSLQLGDTLLTVNGFKPYELFNSYCDYIKNIKKLFDTDSLIVQKSDGNLLKVERD